MATIKDYLDYAELAQAAYGDLKAGMHGDSYKYIDKNGEEKNILTYKNDNIKFTDKQAENFSKRYKVLATSQEYGIGDVSNFQAVLFEEYDEYNHPTGKKIFAIRGSQEITDYIVDVVELAVGGTIMSQTASMEIFYNALVDDHKIKSTDILDVTGHSLGGFLAQYFTMQHPDVVNQTYTYNAPGYGGIKAEIFEALGILNPSMSASKIINIYAKEGYNMTAGLGVLIGDTLALSIDGQEGANLLNHKIGRLTESLTVYDMLSSITKTQDIQQLTSILENVSNEKIIEVIEKVFLDPQSSTSLVDQAIALSDNNKAKSTGLTNLYNKTPLQLNSTSKADLYALINLNPFAIKGNLPAYNDIDVKDYSNTYLEKRSEMLYYTMHPESKNTGDGTDGKDDMVGFNNDDHLFGGKGNDTLVGQGGEGGSIDEEFGNASKSGFHRNFASQLLFASFYELKQTDISTCKHLKKSLRIKITKAA